MRDNGRTRFLLPLATLVLAAAAPARAGEVAVEGHAGYFSMTASNSASALFDSDGGPTFGGALRFTFWRGAFASAGARTFSMEGERVFVEAPNSPVQKLGFPFSMKTTPVFTVFGYRFRDGGTFVPYVQAGGTVTLYSETSSAAGESFDQSFSKAGFIGAVGVEAGRGRFRLAAEAGWSTVPNAIGQGATAGDLGGVAKVYGDDDIGGTYVIGKLVVVLFGGNKPKP
jgi:hypothetical protein